MQVVVGVMTITKDVENDHPDKPHQPDNQHHNEFLCHGCVSLLPVWFIWSVSSVSSIRSLWSIRLVWFNQIDKTNQTNETDQIDRTDQMNKSGALSIPASRVPNLKYVCPLSSSAVFRGIAPERTLIQEDGKRSR